MCGRIDYTLATIQALGDNHDICQKYDHENLYFFYYKQMTKLILLFLLGSGLLSVRSEITI